MPHVPSFEEVGNHELDRMALEVAKACELGAQYTARALAR